jgi:hypothetical protein
MSGGTCEATAYQECGYPCAAVCVALGNYHNCAPEDRIAEESVSASDAISMAELLMEGAVQMKNFQKLTKRLPARLEKYAREAVRNLKTRKLIVDWLGE